MADLELGTKLTLIPASSLEQQSQTELHSVFEAFLPNDHILVLAPIYKGILYPIPIGEVLFIYYTDEAGRYDFQCRVTDRLLQENIHFLRARLLTNIIHKQRRNDFRVDKSLRGTLTINRHQDEELQEIESTCLSADISGGGISIYANEYFDPGDIGIITIPAGPDGEVVRFNSEIIWIIPSDRPNFKYFMGLRFLHENAREQERMSKYVFQMQYEMLQMRHMR